MEEKCLAIITARGGSKRIPRKNIKSFLGKPIIHYSIAAALEAGCFSDVMVSTDDQEIKESALEVGASVPFLRSDGNSNDFATTADVIKEVLDAYKSIGKEFEYCCGIYPTAPFITGEKLFLAFSKLKTMNADGVVPVVKYGFPIMRSFKIEDERIKMNWPEYMTTRSQDIPDAFHDCGQFYFLKVESFLKTHKLFSENTIPLIIPETEVQDIDTEEDWKIAEIKYRFLLERQGL